MNLEFSALSLGLSVCLRVFNPSQMRGPAPIFLFLALQIPKVSETLHPLKKFIYVVYSHFPLKNISLWL